MLIISQERETFIYESLDAKPVLSINRDFSAPIIVEQVDVDFAFLMKHDTNSFIKYEAAQAFGVETIEAMMQGEEINPAFIDSFGHLLRLDLDLSYKALLLELPSVSTLMQRQEEVDFEPIYEAKEKLSKQLATVFKEELLVLYKEHHQTDASLDSLSMGKRRLKNRVLYILSGNETQELAEIAQKQYGESQSMSDRVVALDILESFHPAFAQVALADFYDKYKDETLVMNKYFSILAASKREGTLDRVQALQNDAVYDEKVPNLVRSLIGVFARNYKHFHSKDGHGYSFVADKIIEIDKINAQMASGLAGAFKIYTHMNKRNKELMKHELERIISTDTLSKNSFEIISKILK
ncbi:MAG: aminopeptidase N C-terminal domain-containing protein [Sulfurimonas sp.]|nr:aminopeptidase N C-terminal domain-containing protein [Sulfurimonas sp.]